MRTYRHAGNDADENAAAAKAANVREAKDGEVKLDVVLHPDRGCEMGRGSGN